MIAKAKLMISFAAGLIVSAGVCGLVYFSSSSEVSGGDTNKQPTEEQMKSLLDSSGYVILTEEEWAAAKTVKQNPEEEAAGTEEATQEPQKEKVIYRTILNVASGMTSIDVGRALVQGKIIDDAQTFFKEVEKRGLANDLKPGSYQLDSEMTMDEVISVMFK